MSKKILKIIYDFLFQQNCLLCKQSADDSICQYCFIKLQGELNLTKQLVEFDQEYDYYHLLKYSPEVKYLLQKFKFQKDLLVGEIFLKLMQYWWDKSVDASLQNVDAIAIIPIHRLRYIYRGFNQAEVLAKGLASYANLATTFDNYTRIKYTRSQANLSKLKREEQIKGVFKLNQPIIAKHLLIFDDVMTTGSTLQEFIQTIKQYGSQINKISILTLVRPS